MHLFCLIVLFFSTAVDDLVVLVSICCWVRTKVYVLRVMLKKMNNYSNGNFYFCYVRVRRARVRDIRCSCLCFVVGVLLGRQGSVFSTHALSNKALFCGEAKISARATQSLKTNTTRGIKSGIIVVVVLMNNRCLESS